VSRPAAALPVHPALWRGEQCAPAVQAVPSGFAPLDDLLPGRGWPQGALTEIASPLAGIGELRLLMPACARLTRAGRWVVFVAPPWIPYAPALAGAGLDPARLLLVRTDDRQARLWALEQALRSPGCGGALAWPDAPDERSLRRLQLACEQGGTTAWLFVPEASLRNPSPAALRLRLAAADDGRLEVRIHKRRGGVVTTPLLLQP